MLATTIITIIAVLLTKTDQYMDLLGQVPADTLNQLLSQSGMSMEQVQQLLGTQEGQQLAQQVMAGQISLDRLQAAAQNSLAQQSNPTNDNQILQNSDNNDYYHQNNVDSSQKSAPQQAQFANQYQAPQQYQISDKNELSIKYLEQDRNQQQPTNPNNDRLDYVALEQFTDEPEPQQHTKNTDKYISQYKNNKQYESEYSVYNPDKQNTDTNTQDGDDLKLSNQGQNDNQMRYQQEGINQNRLQQDTDSNNYGLEYGIQKQSGYETDQITNSAKLYIQEPNYQDQNQTLNRTNFTVTEYQIPSNLSLSNGFWSHDENSVEGIVAPDLEQLGMQEDRDIFEDGEILQPLLGSFNFTTAKNTTTYPRGLFEEDMQQQQGDNDDEDEGGELKMSQKLFFMALLLLFAAIL